MSEAAKKVEAYKKTLLEELLAQCTDPQRELFHKLFLYSDGWPKPDQWESAVSLVERTIKKNSGENHAS